MYWDEVNARTCDKSRWCVGDINEDSPISVKANAKEMNGTVKFQHTTGKGTSRPGGQRHEEPFVCFNLYFIYNSFNLYLCGQLASKGSKDLASRLKHTPQRERMNREVSKSQKG